MNERKLTCIQCPHGCSLIAQLENGRVISVHGQQCPKGESYARQEIEKPMRSVTTSVITNGLEMPVVPVRTTGDIPKDKVFEVVKAIQSFVLNKPVKVGDILLHNILDLGVDVIATREAR